MNTTKDIVDANSEEENNDVDVATTSDNQPNTNTSTTSTNTTSLPGLQQTEDDNSDMPLPMGMAEEISNTVEPKQKMGKVEQIDDDDNGPAPPAAMLETSFNVADLTDKTTASSLATSKVDASDVNSSNQLADLTEALQSGKISAKEVQDILNALECKPTTTSTAEYTNELNNPPMPFNSVKYEEDAIAKKIAKEEMNQKPAAVSNTNNEVLPPPTDRDSIYELPREVIEGGEGIIDNTNTGRRDTKRRGWDDIGSGGRQNNNSNDTSTQIAEISSTIEEGITDNNNVNVGDNSDDTAIHIPEAFLVEDGFNDNDGEVYIATPTLPWWKQRRTKILLGAVIVIVGALAIALGVSLSQSNIPEQPSVQSPQNITYDCFDIDDGGKDGILGFAVRSYISQDCANDTKCVIAQTYGWPMNSWCVGNVTDMSELFKDMNTFNEDINGWNTSSVTTMNSMFVRASVFNGDVSNFDTSSVTDMSGMFYGAKLFNGDVSKWNTSSVTNMRSMFREATSFDGNLTNWSTSLVTDIGWMFYNATSFDGDVSNFDTLSVTTMFATFEDAKSFSGQGVSSWNLLSVTDMTRMFDGASSFNQDLCSWQDTFPYINTEDIFTNSSCTYQDRPQEAQKGPFCASKYCTAETLMNITAAVGKPMPLFSNEVLVSTVRMSPLAISSANRGTANYEPLEDTWTLSGPSDSGQISDTEDSFLFVNGQTTGLVDMRLKVKSYNAESPNDCSGLMIRQSLDPGSRHFSILYCGDKRVRRLRRNRPNQSTEGTFDNGQKPSEIIEGDVWLRIKFVKGNYDGFAVYYSTDGIDWVSPDWGGHFAFSGGSGPEFTTTSNFYVGIGLSRFTMEVSNFTINGISSSKSLQPTQSPTLSPTVSPSTSSKPTQSPTVSSFPTETCYWIDIVVVFDAFPDETSWNIQTINDSGDNIVLKTFNGTSDDKYNARTESMCIEGEQTYQFTIYDSYGDGLTASGHYNVTSDGTLIVQGGDFDYSESTTFSIPYVISQQAPNPNLEAESSLSEDSSISTATSPPSVTVNTSSPPVASPDSASVSIGDKVFVSVLDNDTPAAGKTLEVNRIVTQASNGICSRLDLVEVIYEPNPGFTGFDSCVYEACDSVPACDTATLTVIVVGT